METSANTVYTIGPLQFLRQQCSYATFSAPVWISEMHSAASASVKEDVYTYRITIKHCSPPPQLAAEGWRWGSVETPALQHSPPQSHHQYCLWNLLFLPRCWQHLRTDKYPVAQEAPSHYSLSLKSMGLSGWFLAGPTLFEELKPCSGIEPTVIRDRKVLGSTF